MNHETFVASFRVIVDLIIFRGGPLNFLHTPNNGGGSRILLLLSLTVEQ